MIKVDVDLLNKIIKDTVENLEKSKEQMSEILEAARLEKENLNKNMIEIKKEYLKILEELDMLEITQLATSTNNKSNVKVKFLKEREKWLKVNREKNEECMHNINLIVARSENLTSKIGMASNYLTSSVMGFDVRLGERQHKQHLGMRIIKAQEEERSRVAREIHDGPAQSMANIVLRAEICEKLLEKSPREVRKELIGLKSLVRNSLQDVRKIIFDLRPMVLDDLGLKPTLTRYISEFKKKSDLIIDFNAFEDGWDRLGGALEIAIFRIIQEALNNVQKHATAKRVSIQAEKLKNKIIIRIRDDGCGFEKNKVLSASRRGSYGLIGIQERVELLNGTFEIFTKLGEGTDILVQIPVTQKSEGKLEDGNYNFAR